MNICFNGCSFTVGEGFMPTQRDEFIYDRLVSRKLNLNATNIATPGASNYKIFMSSASAILSGNYDLVVVQWSALNRIWLHPGPDSNFFVNDKVSLDFKCRELYLNKLQKEIFRNTLLLMNHDYQNIIDLVDYCKILTTLASPTKVIFVNGLVPWTADISIPLTDNLSDCMSSYSKEILDFDNRNDAEVIKLFKILQDKFGELDRTRWVNLFDSFQKNTVDIGPEGHHPGPKSHAWMAEKIESYLVTNQLCNNQF